MNTKTAQGKPKAQPEMQSKWTAQAELVDRLALEVELYSNFALSVLNCTWGQCQDMCSRSSRGGQM